jgi:hypothetical protein
MSLKKSSNKAYLTLIFIISMVLVFVGCSGNKYRRMAESHLSENYPTIEFNFVESIYHIDGDIHEIKFTKKESLLEYSVYIYSDSKIKDNYMRANFENLKKIAVTEMLKDKIDAGDIQVFLQYPFEEDEELIAFKNNYESLNFNIDIYHHGGFSVDELSNTYGHIVRLIFSQMPNIDYVLIKNYDDSNNELYFEIDRKVIGVDFSDEEFKKLINDNKIIFSK